MPASIYRLDVIVNGAVADSIHTLLEDIPIIGEALHYWYPNATIVTTPL